MVDVVSHAFGVVELQRLAQDVEPVVAVSPERCRSRIVVVVLDVLVQESVQE